MKSLAIALLFSAALYAQTPKPPDPAIPPPPASVRPPAHTPPRPQQMPPSELTPKKSIATEDLKLAEAEKKHLLDQAQAIANSANMQIKTIQDQLADKDKEIAAEVEEVKKENGWGKDEDYVQTFYAQDGKEFPGHWQKRTPPPPAPEKK